MKRRTVGRLSRKGFGGDRNRTQLNGQGGRVVQKRQYQDTVDNDSKHPPVFTRAEHIRAA